VRADARSVLSVVNRCRLWRTLTPLTTDNRPLFADALHVPHHPRFPLGFLRFSRSGSPVTHIYLLFADTGRRSPMPSRVDWAGAGA